MKMPRILFLAGLVAAASLAAAQTSKTLATVEGQIITEQQVLQAAAADLTRLDANKPQPQAAYDRARLQILWKALDSIVEDKLITLEAAKNNMTKARLIEIEIDLNIQTPSPQEVDRFYEANKAQITAQIPGPKAQALPQVRQYMIDDSRRRYRNSYIGNLRRNYKITTNLDPLRTEIATAGYPSKGPANALVTIVEFADFECPVCGGLHPTLKQIERAYSDKVRFVYRQFPIASIHPNAQKAAEASLCANDQQRFWEFHDALFANQIELGVPALKQRAVTLRMNAAAFNTCLDSGKHADTVRKDQEEARKLGVSGTPTTFINGRLLSGNQPFAAIRDVIEDELVRLNSQ
jgi:predicted DsbA family dithiol-disulfide isomerase